MILCLALLLSVAGLRAQVPFFTLTPSNRVVAATYDVTFPLAAEGASPLTYQWFFNGSPLADATNYFLTLTTVSNDSAGAYHAIVTNDFGSITSAPVTLTVVAPLTAATFAGSVSAPGVADGQGPDARFYLPSGIALDEAGTLYVAEAYGLVIRAISPGGHVRTLAGLAEVSGTNDGVGTNALFAEPQGLVMTRAGHLFVADAGSHTIRKVTRDGTVTTFAGQAGSVGADDGPGPDARFYLPQGLAVDTNDNLYVADRNNGAIRKITPEGVVSTVTNDTSFAEALAFDDAGNLYFSYYWSSVMKRAPDGTTTLLAGEPSVYGESDGLGAAARFTHVRGLVWHRNGYLLVADGHRVRRISTNGLVTTLAGSTPNNFQDGTGFGAGFHIQGATALDASGHLYTSDSYNHTIRKLGFGVALVWEPDDVAVALGSNVTLSVTAASDVPVSYRWRFHGTPLPGATNATLELTNVSFATAGNYTVIVSNELRAVTSRVARVVIPTLQLAQQGRGTITAAPAQATYAPGEDVLLTATPARYHEFVGWSDGVTTPDRIITVGLENSFTAIFTNSLPLEWQPLILQELVFGTTENELSPTLSRRTNEGFFLVGHSSAGTNGNKLVDGVMWTLALGPNLDVQWQQGHVVDANYTVRPSHYPLADGGIIQAGAKGDLFSVNANPWSGRANTNGSPLWNREYNGFGGGDYFNAVGPATDGGFLFGGTIAYNGMDFYLARTDTNGLLSWTTHFGGSNFDEVFDLEPLPGGGALLFGYSYSPADGSKSAPQIGVQDFWLVCVDAAGNKLWDRTYGADWSDFGRSITPTHDGGFLLGGTTYPGSGGNRTAPTYGNGDYWIVKIDQDGGILWDKSFGGSGDDLLRGVRLTSDGGFLLVGESASPVSGNKTSAPFGNSDCWLVKVDVAGNKQWDLTLGGTAVETVMESALEVSPDQYLAAISSSSGSSGNRSVTGFGGSDFWLVRFEMIETPPGTPVIRVNGQPANYRTNIFNTQTPVTITLTSSWNGPIHFTTDGSEPDFGSAQYDPQNPPQVAPPATVKAIAYIDDLYQASELYVDFSEVVSTHLEYVPLYTASLSTPGGGTVAVTPAAATYVSNSVVTIAATNLPGWTFLGWQGGVTSTNPVEVVTLNSNFIAQAIFGTTLTTLTNGLGSVSRFPTQTFYAYGSTVRLTALPGAARYLAFWTGALAGAISPRDLVMTNANPVVGATFGTLAGTNFGLTVQITGEGTVSYTPATNRLGSNSVVTLTATPKPGWVFTNWTGGSNSTANPLALVMHTNKVITAGFLPDLPRFITQPVGRVVREGVNPYFSAVVAGAEPITHQWRFNGTNLPGETNFALFLFTVQTNQSGAYSVVIGNAFGSVTSSPASLVVTQAPSGRSLVSWGWSLTMPTNVTDAIGLTCGDGHGAVLLRDGSVIPFGNSLPPEMTNVVAVEGGSLNEGNETLALRRDGTVVSSIGGVPPGLSNMVAVASGSFQRMALRRDGTVAAWGQSYGIPPADLRNVVAISSGTGGHNLALRNDGTVVAWGDNTSGRTNVPAGLSNVIAIAAGGFHSLALRADGTIAGWGANDHGQAVAPVSNVVAIAAGLEFSLALKSDGQLVQWGNAAGLPAGLGLVLDFAGAWGMGVALVATNLSPSVAIFDPPNGAVHTAGSNLWIRANVTGGATNVAFFANAVLLGSDASAPFEFNWLSPSPGSYALTAVATDGSGLSITSAPVSITVNPGNQAPLVSISSPTNSSIFPVGTNITITAGAADPDGTVSLVEFFAGTNLLGTDAVAPFALTWSNVAAGTYALTARATDNLGAQSISAANSIVVATLATNPPVFSWSNAAVSVGEAGGAVTLHVLKSADSAQVPADIGFHPQSASADTADFTPPGFSLLSFGVGETVKPITIPITQDSLVESNHFFLMVLDLITGSISGPAEAQITIVDDDIPGTNSFLTRVAPGALPSPLATLRVDLSPTNVGQWRFVWENAWHDGGSQISGLPPGNYELQFKPVSGYVEPLATYVAVITNTLNQYSFTYSNTAAPQLGSLVVNINPAFVATNGNPNERGQWRRVGEGAWRDSGTTADALPAGTHVIEFKLLTAGSWQTPSAQEVTVLPNQLNVALGEYFVANPTPGTPPTALNFSSQMQNPFGFQRGYQFVGQLLTPLGWGSGTVVKQRVVLTAAHVVFNDYALAFVPNDAVKWFFQRQAGEYEPAPQTPRGFVVLSGYAAQRQAEASPGISGTASRDLDIAAIYFGESAGRGGFSGYLVSRPGQEYLQLATSASLAGYPVEGIPAQDRGKMHRTEERGVSWSVVSNQVYATTDLKSYPGNSGGPILVQLATNVNYWPAAVYLGGSGNTIVRAIDDLAVGLINTAEALGNAGGNNTGGEPPRRSTDCPTCSPLIYGVLEVSLTPTNIGALGGGYRFKNATNGVIYREPFNRFFVLGNVPWTLEFLPSPYTIAPTNRTITTTAGHTNRTTGLYRQWGQLGFSDGQLRMFGSSGAVYRIDFKPTLTTNVWTPVKTQTLSGAGVTLTNLVPGASNGFFRAVLLP